MWHSQHIYHASTGTGAQLFEWGGRCHCVLTQDLFSLASQATAAGAVNRMQGIMCLFHERHTRQGSCLPLPCLPPFLSSSCIPAVEPE